jgi:UDPglucose--hexose-1-phosphate uridylyltransferase
MGAWIGDVAPEVAAANIREAIARADAATPVIPAASTEGSPA